MDRLNPTSRLPGREAFPLGRVPCFLPGSGFHEPRQHSLHGPVRHAFQQAPADPLPEAAALGECCQPRHQHTQDLLYEAHRGGPEPGAMDCPVSAPHRSTSCIAKPSPRGPGQLASAHPGPGPGKGTIAALGHTERLPPSTREPQYTPPPRTAARRNRESARMHFGFSPERKHSLCLPWTQAFPRT